MMTGLLIGMIIGVTVWWVLIQRLQDKPWTEHGVIEGSQDGLTSSAPKVGLWVFLAMVTSFFLIFNSAYLMRMGFGHGSLHDWVSVPEPSLLWLNTLLLIAASVSMQISRGCAIKGNLAGVKKYFTAAGVFTVLFLAGQVMAWRQLGLMGEYNHTNPAYTFFILLTAIHGLHLIGGLWVLSRTAARVWHGLANSDVVQVGAVRQSVQLCTTYWHYLLIVWLALFTLLSLT
jgi:cytochrome c oxidase subunit 3